MASKILGIVFIALCFIAATKALSCFNCKTNNPNDSCFQNPSAVAKKTCLPGIQKCVVRRTYDTVNNNVSELERDCELNVPIFGDKTECKTTGNLRECQVVCNTDSCNDVPEQQVEDCVRTFCRSSASIKGVMTPLLLFAVVVKFVF